MHRMDEEMRRCVGGVPGLPPRVPDDGLAALPQRRRQARRAAAHAADAGLRRDLPHERLLHGTRDRVPQAHLRRLRGEVCEECAKSCEQVGDMEECVETCRRCAECCRRMAE